MASMAVSWAPYRCWPVLFISILRLDTPDPPNQIAAFAGFPLHGGRSSALVSELADRTGDFDFVTAANISHRPGWSAQNSLATPMARVASEALA